MPTVLIAIAVFAVALLGMAVGVIFSNRCIRGSCGGLATFRDDQGRSMCEACSTPSPECRARLDAKNGQTVSSVDHAVTVAGSSDN